jgi:hypothetical protein
MNFTLDVTERHALMEAAAATTDRHHWRRIRALLLLAEGRNVTETARALGTTRQSVYRTAVSSCRSSVIPTGSRSSSSADVAARRLRRASIVTRR